MVLKCQGCQPGMPARQHRWDGRQHSFMRITASGSDSPARLQHIPWMPVNGTIFVRGLHMGGRGLHMGGIVSYRQGPVLHMDLALVQCIATYFNS